MHHRTSWSLGIVGGPTTNDTSKSGCDAWQYFVSGFVAPSHHVRGTTDHSPPPQIFEVVWWVLPRTTATFLNLRFISVTYRMNISALNRVPYVLKNRRPQSVTTLYTVTFLWLPVYGTSILTLAVEASRVMVV